MSRNQHKEREEVNENEGINEYDGHGDDKIEDEKEIDDEHGDDNIEVEKEIDDEHKHIIDFRSGIFRTTDECHIIQRSVCRNKSIDTIYKLIERFPIMDVKYEKDYRSEMPFDDCHIQRAIQKYESVDMILKLIEQLPLYIKYKKNDLGNYSLHTACDYGQNVVAMKLIQLFPNAVHHKNLEGLYPLQLVFRRIDHHDESEDQTEDLIMKLIEIYPFAIQIDINHNGEYPIHCAIRNNHSIAVIKLLLDNDPFGMQRIGHYNKSPFHVAFEKKYFKLIKYFMEERTDLQINAKDSYGYTSLHYACTDHKPLHCVSNDNNVINDIFMFHIILRHPDINVNATNDLFDTPLHSTLKSFLDNPSRCVIIVQKLLNHSCIIIDLKNKDLNTPLDIINRHTIHLEKIINDQHLLPLRTLQERSTPSYIIDQHLSSLRTLRTLQKAKEQLSYGIEIVHILQEFPIKRRWNAYCYHINNFI